jgi:hypothetical protein
VPGAPALDKATQEKVRELLKERRDVLRKALEARQQAYRAGRGTWEGVVKVSRRLLGAELDLAGGQAERVAAYQSHLDRVRKLEEVTKALYEAGQVDFAEMQLARAARLKAEVEFLRAGGKRPKAK